MGVVRWLLGGAVGGLIGAVIWSLIAYLTSREIGYVAWGLGLLVGLGVRIAAGEDEHGCRPGIVAAVLAVIFVQVGKVLVVVLIVLNTPELVVTDDDMIVLSARSIAAQREAKGQKLAWPVPFLKGDRASEKEHFPPAVWTQATADWNKLSPGKRQEQKDALRAFADGMVKAERSQVIRTAVRDSYTPFDLLWVGLAAITAFRLGSGVNTE